MNLGLGLGALVVTSHRAYHANSGLFHADGLALRPIGKSSFVRQQQRNRENPWLSGMEVLSSQEILQLARNNSKRTRGSRAYQSSWRHWVEQTTMAIRQELVENLPHPVHVEELARLSLELGIAADRGEMPSFSHPGARSGYALDYFCRARLLAGLLIESQVADDIASLWRSERNRTIHLTSLGGGPGFDFVALAMVILFEQCGDNTQQYPQLNATVLDYEEGWNDLVHVMNDSTTTIFQRPNFHCHWGGKCDITKPLSHSSNQACLVNIATTNIWTCQYCIAENAQQLRSSNYIFFHDLWNAMPDQSLVILTETTPRLWPELYRIVEESCPFMQVTFPNYKGPQMFLRKCSTSSPSSSSSTAETKTSLSDRDRKLLQEFQEISARHEERQQSGWTRQVKKEFQTLVS
jgi:hypothetical protein